MDEIQTYADGIAEEWAGAEREEDGRIVYEMSVSAEKLADNITLLNGLRAARAAEEFVEDSFDKLGSFAEDRGAAEEVGEAEVSMEEGMGKLVGAMELLIAVVFAAFAIPAVLALLGFILKFDLLNLLALLVGAALTFLVHGAVLTVIVAVVLLAHFLMCRSINKAYRAFRRQN